MDNSNEPKKVPAPDYTSFILICEKCGAKLNPNKDLAQELKKELKNKIKSLPNLTGFRPMVSSCMDICPDNEMSISVMPLDGKTPEFFTVGAEDIPQVADQILNKLVKA